MKAYKQFEQMRDIPFWGTSRLLRDLEALDTSKRACERILPRGKKKLMDEKAAGSAKRSLSHAVGYHELDFKDVSPQAQAARELEKSFLTANLPALGTVLLSDLNGTGKRGMVDRGVKVFFVRLASAVRQPTNSLSIIL